MVKGFVIHFSTQLKNTATPKLQAALKSLAAQQTNVTKQMAAEIGKTTSHYQRLDKVVKNVAETINKQFGGRVRNGAGDLNNFGQNLSSISNRLGFMAFQWNFMANAANRAVDIVLGGLQSIITEGAKTSDAVARALAFGTSITGISTQSAEATKDLQILRDAIYAEGSGKTIFGVDVVSNIAKELSKASPDTTSSQEIANILPFATKLKEIEPQLSDERIGTGLVSLFGALGTNTKNIEEVSAAMDFLSNVSDKSTATFQSSIGSLGVAAQQAKTIGVDAFELGTIIQRVADLNARNKAGGRAAATPGEYANAFFRDLQAFSDITTKQGKAAAEFGLNLFEAGKNGTTDFKDLIGVAKEFEKQLDGLGEADKAAKLSRLGLGENSQRVVLDLLNDQGISLEQQIEQLKQRGTLEARAAASTVSAQSQILRIQAAISSSKSIIAEGFGRTLKTIADGLSEITSNSEFKKLLGDIGIILGNYVIPHLKNAFKFVKLLINFLTKNKKTLRFVVGAVLALSVALAGLAIIATIGFFALVAGSSLFGMAGQMTIATAATKTLVAGLTLVLKRLIPMAIVGLGIVLIGAALSGMFDDSLTPAVVAFGVAMSALGAILLFPSQSLSLMSKGITGLISLMTRQTAVTQGATTAMQQYMLARKPFDLGGKTGSGLVAGSRAPAGFGAPGFGGEGLLGKNMATRFVTGFQEVMFKQGPDKQITRSLSTLGKAGIIGAVAAVGAGLMIAFIQSMEQQVEESAIFKTGLVDKWQQVGFRMTAATNVFLRNVAKAFVDFGTAVFNIFKDTSGFIQKVLGAIWDSFVAIITLQGFDEAKRRFQEGLADAFGEFDLFQTFTAVLDPTGVTGAVDEIKNSLGELEKAGFSRFDPIVVETLADILDAFKVSAEDFNSSDIQTILDEIFPEESLMSGLTPAIGAVTTAFEKETKTVTETDKKLIEYQKAITQLEEAGEEEVMVRRDINAAVKDSIEYTSENTNKISELTANVLTESEVIGKKVDIQKLQIIEIAENINAMILNTGFIYRANTMWANIIANGNAFAKRIDSAWMDSKGRWHYIRYGVSDEDSATIKSAEKNYQNFVGNAQIIDIQALKAELEELKIVLSTATAGYTGTQPGTQEGDYLVNPDGSLNPQYQAAIAAALAAGEYTGPSGGAPGAYQVFGGQGDNAILAPGAAIGSTQIDINVDGTFDITVQQGGLTTDQMKELERQISTSLLNAIENELGVQR